MAGAAWLVRLQPALLLLACCLLWYANGLLHELAGTGSSGSSSSSGGSVFLNRPTAALHSEGSGGTRAQRSAAAAGAGAGAQDASNRWLQAEQGSGQGSSQHPLLRHPRRQIRLRQRRQNHKTTTIPSSQPVPLVLWQTYRTSSLPAAAQQLVSSWQTLNPELDMRMHNDSRASTFINRTFVDDLIEVYHKLPLGVMRADLFRYAILYARGGVYADVDTRPLKPLARWLPPKDNGAKGLPLARKYATQLTWDSCSLLIGLEEKRWFCQWVIAGVARHPVLEAALRLIVRRAKDAGTIDVHNIEFVHQHTGPTIWTEAVVEYLRNATSLGKLLPGTNSSNNAGKTFEPVYTHPELYQEVRDLGVCLVGQPFLSKVNVQNLYGSKKGMRSSGEFEAGWDGWKSWIEERMVVRGSTNPWSRRRRQ